MTKKEHDTFDKLLNLIMTQEAAGKLLSDELKLVRKMENFLAIQ